MLHNLPHNWVFFAAQLTFIVPHNSPFLAAPCQKPWIQKYWGIFFGYAKKVGIFWVDKFRSWDFLRWKIWTSVRPPLSLLPSLKYVSGAHRVKNLCNLPPPALPTSLVSHSCPLFHPTKPHLRNSSSIPDNLLTVLRIRMGAWRRAGLGCRVEGESRGHIWSFKIMWEYLCVLKYFLTSLAINDCPTFAQLTCSSVPPPSFPTLSFPLSPSLTLIYTLLLMKFCRL